MEKTQLKNILSDQQEEARMVLSRAYVPRELLQEAEKYLKRNWAIVITGIRRSGKSAFAHQLLKNEAYTYVNFDDERLIQLKSKDLDLLFESLLEIHSGGKVFLFDEIQNISGWELFVNRLLRRGYRIVVTGSNARLLSQELATHLTGRSISLELFPFSFREFLVAKQFLWKSENLSRTETKVRMLGFFGEYLKTGGFPEMILGGYSGAYLRELYNRVLTKDIAIRKKFREVMTLQEVALYFMSHAGSRQTFQKTTKSLQISNVVTVKNMVHAMEEAYLLIQVPPFSFKVKEVLRLPRKYYAIDTGLQTAISLNGFSDWGSLLESFVCLELRREKPELYYYLDKNAEVDFVLREGRRVSQLIQCCYSLHDSKTCERETAGFEIGLKQLRCNNMLLLSFSEDRELLVGRNKVQVIPAWRWALEKD